MPMPEKPSIDGLELKWDARWHEQGTYRFDRSRQRADIYSIDTPPPTVSGSLHMGSFFGYVQVDAIARFHRMRGKEVFYPMGWDDNGLPTERRVQNYYGVWCDPSVPHDPAAAAAIAASADGNRSPKSDPAPRPVSRRTFVELCHLLTAHDEQAFEEVWRFAGLSVDWTLTYATIGDRSRRAAQRAFLRNVARGEAYAGEAPTLWDVDLQTAVAQAELEDREISGACYRLAFTRPGGEPAEVETTRPELLAACVALVAHPGDERYRKLAGSHVTTPVFGVSVPVLTHPLAEPDKGTGIAMICTFGDVTDVIWWRELGLPVRPVIGRDGRIVRQAPDWLPARGAAAWPRLAGKTAKQARQQVAALLAESGDLIGTPRPITHPVKFYEKGERPLEIVTSRQWYIRNGAHDTALREVMLGRGRELNWHPPFMRVRYEHWVGGLSTDWLISRQRYFGVPFPVWYPVSKAGEVLWDEPMLCPEDDLPIDPQADPPPGFSNAQRGQPGGFVGDPDVMDTWATSSLTPLIICGWTEDPELFARTFPMDLRPQGPEIIRTWLFATVLRSQLEQAALPWRNAIINGWILDPDRKKMSKSKGNVVTPMDLLRQFGADGLRYWASCAAPGTDTVTGPAQMRTGRRLANKVLNVSRFVLGLDGQQGARLATARPEPTVITEALDRAMLARLATVIDEATAAFEAYQYQLALEQVETFFWDFCDNYVELVKGRGYGDGPVGDSARAALACGLDVILRLFAPFLPFVTEEVWSWWRPGSVHRAAWPASGELHVAGDPAVLAAATAALTDVRKAKSTRKLSLRTEVSRVVLRDIPERIEALRRAEPDLRQAGVIAELVLQEGAERSVSVELASPAA